MVPSWYQNEKNSISGSFFREQALALLRRGHRVWVADATYQSFDNITSKRLLRLCKFSDEGLETYSFIAPAIGIARTPSGGVNWFYRRLRRIYKEILRAGVKIDIVQAHSFYPAGVGALRLCKEYDLPLVMTEHNSLVLKEKLHPKRIPWLCSLTEEADRFICVSNALKESVLRLTKTEKDIEVIPNSVDGRFSFKDEKPDSPFTFVSIGNLVAGKRFDLTLQAFSKVLEAIPGAKLSVVGDGPLKSELRELAEKLGISSSVSFTGRIPREDLCTLLNRSHVFVLPSDAETFGVVYVEALACGCPVIATRNGGAEEIVTEDRGILTEKNDVKALTKAMLKMYSDYSIYDPKKLSEACLGEYSEDVLAQRTEEIYLQVLSDK